MLVYIHSNYSYPDLLRQTPSSNGKWGDIQFTFDEVDECDFIVVLNHPTKDIKVRCRKGGKILLIQEPPYERNNYLISYFPYFDKIICAFDKKYSPDIINIQAALPWLINKNYQQLLILPSMPDQKKDHISWVTSNSNVNPGHEPRLRFLEILKQSNLNIDLFGRGIKPIDDKFDGLYPYKYTLAIENYSDNNYWTEKIADAFLAWTIPIYYGCKNIEDFFPENSYIKIDIHKPDEAVRIISNSIKNKFYDNNIMALEEARGLILSKYQFFPYMTDFIKNNPIQQTQKYINCFIPVDTNSKGLINRIKLLIKK